MATQVGHGGGFVDRTEQLTLLAARHGAAKDGQGSIVLLAGDAGAGKSRIAYEFCRGISDASIATGQCLEYAQAPFGPVLSVLERLIKGDPSVLRAAPVLSAAMARLLPDVEGLVSPDATEPDKLRQLNALSEALALFAARRVAIIVIEDVHWADSATLELLQHLPPYVAESKMLVICTYRRDELRRGHPLRAAIAKIERHAVAHSTSVPPLSDDDMHQLVFGALGEQWRGRPAAEVIDAIIVRAEGNPLFAEELLRTLAEAETNGAVRAVPASVREAVLERLETLDESSNALLACAAAIGRRFEAEFLAQIAGQSMETVLATLKRAIGLGFIVEDDSERMVLYAFRHELIREAIYHELLASEARRLHASIAKALEALPSGGSALELAYHWWSARDPERSAQYNELAGDAAMAVFAYRDAATHFDRALALGGVNDARAAGLQRKLTEALFRAGYSERARRAAQAALEYYESAGDKESAAQTCISLARLAGFGGDPVSHRRYAARALELVGESTSSPAFFAGHVEMARSFCVYSVDVAKGREHLEAADSYRGERDPEDAGRFFEFQMTLSALSGEPEKALAATQQASDIASRAGNAPGEARCWANYASAMSESGEPERWRKPIEHALDIVHRNKIAGMTTNWIELALAGAYWNYGESRKAEALVRRLLAANVESPGFRMALARIGITLGLWFEDAELAERCAPASLIEPALASGSGQLIGALAHYADLYLERGDAPAARALLQRSLKALVAAHVHPQPGEVDWLLMQAVRHGDDAEAHGAREILATLSYAKAVPSVRGYIALFEAIDARRRGDATAAIARAQDAAQIFEVTGWPYHRAQALEVAGELAKARDLYRKIEDARDAKRVDAILNPVNRRGRTKGEMTAREREICDLLVKGKTNKAIAEELVISERTVETHVSSILTKTEAASRAELIAKLKS